MKPEMTAQRVTAAPVRDVLPAVEACREVLLAADDDPRLLGRCVELADPMPRDAGSLHGRAVRTSTGVYRQR